METNDKNPGETKWNNHQDKSHQNEELNEGFSAENIDPDYNPSESTQHTETERETDASGNTETVERARFPEANPSNEPEMNADADNRVIENRTSVQNRDRNYDTDPNRYPTDHPDNQKSRGNIDFGK